MNKVKINKQHIATFIAFLFHVSGFIGLLTAKRAWFISYTPLNLLIMLGLILWTHERKNAAFFAFVLITFATGLVTEIIGVNTSLIFGKYEYGLVLGPRIFQVPLLAAVNWFIVMYCCGIAISHLQAWFFYKSPPLQTLLSPSAQFTSFVLDGAMLATFFDLILEPVAVKLGYWRWLGDGSIPVSNFLSWMVVSAGLLTVFRLLSFQKHNQFAVHLLIIETLFFYGLRTFL